MLFVGVVSLVYRFVPVEHVPWRAILVPAVLVGIALGGFAQLFTFIAPRLVGFAALFGTFVTIFALLAWLAISFNMLILGASWTRVRAVARSQPDVPPAVDGRMTPARRRRGRARDRATDPAEAGRDQPWRVPQRRQKRAFADSDRPQLTHGWAVGAGDGGLDGRLGGAGEHLAGRCGPQAGRVGLRHERAAGEGRRHVAADGRRGARAARRATAARRRPRGRP